MALLEIGTWDQIRPYEVEQWPSPADAYDDHIRQVQLMEQVGFKYYWTIEHQSSYVGAITGPTVYLTAVARATQRIHIGAMIWELNPYSRANCSEPGGTKGLPTIGANCITSPASATLPTSVWSSIGTGKRLIRPS
jgi:hypothetical protein